MKLLMSIFIPLMSAFCFFKVDPSSHGTLVGNVYPYSVCEYSSPLPGDPIDQA